MSRKPEDFDLWVETAKSIKPLRPRTSRGVTTSSVKSTSEIKRPKVSPSSPHMQAPASHRKVPPQITGLDRRTTQRLTRGNVEIEQRLDLHGTGIEMARVRLLQFLREAQMVGVRTTLVITGKGDSPYSRHTLHGSDHFHSPERQGRLRRLVPDWFHDAEFRAVVSGYQPAHPKHGGGGAFYVKIRRLREGG
jgi:DNA-nicking Smr family endonuclease